MSSADSAKTLSREKRALLALQKMQQRVDACDRAASEPLAIVGMGCRLPGGACDLESYWQLLKNGVDGSTEVPADRWDADAVKDSMGRPHHRGGFLQQVPLDSFDAGFFGITPAEARELDPQARMLLEVCWEALEDAAIAPASLMRTRTGVFIGIANNDYQMRRAELGVPVNSYWGTGLAFSTAAGRISHTLGIRGPSFAVDTACSSSLVALHQAALGLRSGECDMALVGGVNLMLFMDRTAYFAMAGFLAPDGRCKAFDSRADGYARGEGCGVIVVKRLSDAERSGDRIWALVRGSAVNHDGRTSVLTAPSGPSQQSLHKQVLLQGRLQAEAVQYAEAHGTGTPLGDPIELQALSAVLAEGRKDKQWLAVGSAKTNLGHLEAGAGAAGLIKLVLALAHEHIPPHLHLQAVSSHIEFQDLAVAVTSAGTMWPRGHHPRMGTISSFGFGGTNSSALLQEAPQSTASRPSTDRPVHVLCLSARTEEALQQQAQRMAAHVRNDPQLDVRDVCFTANTGRNHFGCRLAIAARTRGQLLAQLDALKHGHVNTIARHARSGPEATPKLALLFGGVDGTPRPPGQPLYETLEAFRKTVDRCADTLGQSQRQRFVDAVLMGHPVELPESTAALFTLQVGFHEIWRSWGVRSRAVLGTGPGEIAAGFAAGIFSLEDGMRLAIAHGQSLAENSQPGDMLLVSAGEAVARQALCGHEQTAALATVVSPEQVVISGTTEAIPSVASTLKRQGIHTRQVGSGTHQWVPPTSFEALKHAAAAVTYNSPTVGYISPRHGTVVEPATIASPRWWSQQPPRPTRIADAMAALAQLGAQVYLDLSPQAHLAALGRRITNTGHWISCARPAGNQHWRSLSSALARLHTSGLQIDWVAYDAPYVRRKVSLPTYPFERQRYWFEITRAPTTNRPRATGPSLDQRQQRAERSDLARMIANTVAEEQLGLLTDHIREVVAAELGLASAEELDDREPLQNQGMNSILAVELRGRLADALSVDLPATTLFDYATVDALSRYVLEDVLRLSRQEVAVVDKSTFDDQHEQGEPTGLNDDAVRTSLGDLLDSLGPDDMS